jgi:hypothetical protein
VARRAFKARHPRRSSGLSNVVGLRRRPQEVFISYAWGDDTAAGKIRAKVVDELWSALAKDGFDPIRDLDRLRPGDRISAFMRQLTAPISSWP